MRNLLILMTLFCAIGVQAGVLSATMTEAVLETLQVRNGAAGVVSYNTNDFNLGKRISDIKDDNSQTPCEFKVAVSRKIAIDRMRQMGDVNAADMIDSLNKNGFLKTAIVNQAKATEKNIEFCNSTDLEIYSNDGEVLKVIYDERK